MFISNHVKYTAHRRYIKYLIEAGETCSVNRVARLMKVADIKSKMARKFVITTDSKNTLQPAPDLLQRQFEVDTRDKAW